MVSPRITEGSLPALPDNVTTPAQRRAHIRAQSERVRQEWLRRVRSDGRETLGLLRKAQTNIAKEITRYGDARIPQHLRSIKNSIEAEIRVVQQEMSRLIRDSLDYSVRSGVELSTAQIAAQIPADLQAQVPGLVLTEPVFGAVQREAMDFMLRYKQGGLSLSRRLWETSKGVERAIGAEIAQGLAEGKSAAALVARLRRHMSMVPGVTGRGVYRRAFDNYWRITRTEMSRAMSEGYMRSMRVPERDYAKAMASVLSSAHTQLDVCDSYATADLFGLGPGVYPMGDVPMLPYHPHCVTPGQKVRTLRGNLNIEDVQVGDMVLTHQDRWRMVTKVWEQDYDGDIYVVETEHGKMRLTPNHEILMREGDHEEWISAGQLGRVDAGHNKRIIYPLIGEVLWTLWKNEAYSGPVYNLTVDEDHSYTVDGHAVKNCLCHFEVAVDYNKIFTGKDDPRFAGSDKYGLRGKPSKLAGKVDARWKQQYKGLRQVAKERGVPVRSLLQPRVVGGEVVPSVAGLDAKELAAHQAADKTKVWSGKPRRGDEESTEDLRNRVQRQKRWGLL